MNLKKSAIALVVAGIVGAPMVASADGAVYGSARYGLESVGNGINYDADGVPQSQNDEGVVQFRNFGSRFGIKGDRDLGNGMVAFGHWEAHMFGAALRDFKIGVKGDFGQVYMGDGIDHAWDTFMSTDDTWWYGGGTHLTDGVQSNAITYLGGAGAVKFGVTAQMKAEGNNADEEGIDQIEAVVAFDAGPVNIAVGLTDKKTANNDPDAIVGVVVSGAAGDFGYAFDYQSGDDVSSIQLQGSFGNFLAQYGTVDIDVSGAPSPSDLVLSYTQNLAKGALMWYEFRSRDLDIDGADTETIVAATLRVDIL